MIHVLGLTGNQDKGHQHQDSDSAIHSETLRQKGRASPHVPGDQART